MVLVIFLHTPSKILERTEQKKGFRRNLGHSNSILFLKSSQVSSGKRGTLPPRKWVGALFCSIQSILYSYLYIYWIDEFQFVQGAHEKTHQKIYWFGCSRSAVFVGDTNPATLEAPTVVTVPPSPFAVNGWTRVCPRIGATHSNKIQKNIVLLVEAMMINHKS